MVRAPTLCSGGPQLRSTRYYVKRRKKTSSSCRKQCKKLGVRKTAQNGRQDKNQAYQKRNRWTPTQDKKRGRSGAWHLLRFSKHHNNLSAVVLPSKKTVLRVNVLTLFSVSSLLLQKNTNNIPREPVRSTSTGGFVCFYLYVGRGFEIHATIRNKKR